jgi:hypothetical protein
MADYITRFTGPDGISEHLNYENGWGPTNQGESLYKTAAALFNLPVSNFELRCEDGTVIDNDMSSIPCMTGVATIVGITQLGQKTLAEHARKQLKSRHKVVQPNSERSPEMEAISKLVEESSLPSIPLKLADGKVTVHIRMSKAGLYNGVVYFFERYNLIPDVDFKLRCNDGYILDPNEAPPSHCKELTFVPNTKYGEKVEKMYVQGYLKAMEKRPTPRRRGASAAGWRASMSSAESERMAARKKAIRAKVEEQKVIDSFAGLSMGGRRPRNKKSRTPRRRSRTPRRQSRSRK